MIKRSQLPTYSPLSLPALSQATLSALWVGRQAGDVLGERLSHTFGGDHMVLTGSGTQALTLAIELVQEEMGEARPIGLPGYSCFDVVTAAVGAGARVRFYDVDPQTLGPDPGSVEDVLASGVSAIVAGSLFGMPLDWAALSAKCRAAGVVLIEDAAQGLWTTWGEHRGGTHGDLSILSFGRGKGWTGGGGGALLVRKEEWSRRANSWAIPNADWRASLHSTATSFVQWILGRPLLFGIPSAIPGLGLGETRYKDPVPTVRIPEFSAALALRTLHPSEVEVETRIRNANRLMSLLKGTNPRPTLELIEPLGGGKASFLRLPALLSSDSLSLPDTDIWQRIGIRRGYPMPLPDLPAVEHLREDAGEGFPGANTLAKRLVTLPTHSLLIDSDFSALDRAIRRET